MSERPTILIFEDEPILLNSLIDIMIEQEYEVVASTNPRDLLDKSLLLDRPADLALLDIKLDKGSDKNVDDFPPEKAGIVLARRLMEINPIPIVFLTAYKKEFVTLGDLSHAAFFDKVSVDYEDELPQAIERCIIQFENSIYNRFSSLPYLDEHRIIVNNVTKGKDRFIIIDINDILYFEGIGEDAIKLTLKGWDQIIQLSIGPGNFWRLLEQRIIDRKLNLLLMSSRRIISTYLI